MRVQGAAMSDREVLSSGRERRRPDGGCLCNRAPALSRACGDERSCPDRRVASYRKPLDHLMSVWQLATTDLIAALRRSRSGEVVVASGVYDKRYGIVANPLGTVAAFPGRDERRLEPFDRKRVEVVIREAREVGDAR